MSQEIEPFDIHIYVDGDLSIMMSLTYDKTMIYKFTNWNEILLMILYNEGDMAVAFKDARRILIREHID